jgi:hypothetical protein
LGLFGLIFLFVALILVGFGIAVGLVACGLAAALTGLGVISSSVLVGMRSGRAAAGIRAFLLQCGVLAGLPAGAVCAWLVQALVTEQGTTWPVLLFGALGGAVAGTLVALCLDFVSRWLHAWASARFRPSNAFSR